MFRKALASALLLALVSGTGTGCDSSGPVSPDDPLSPYTEADDRLMVEYMIYGEGFDRSDIVVLDSTIVVEGDMLFDKATLLAFLQQNPAAAGAARAGDAEGIAAARTAASESGGSKRQGTFETGPLRWEHADGLGASTSGIPVYVRTSVPSYWASAVQSAVSNWNSYSTSKVRFTYGGVNDNVFSGAVVVSGIPSSSWNYGTNAWAAAAQPIDGELNNAFAQVRVGSDAAAFSAATLTGFFVHELGHSVGLFHTDKVASSSSARQIPRTPTTDSRSIMNSAPSTTALTSTDRFSTADKQALRIVYPTSLGTPTISAATATPVGSSSLNVRLDFSTDANTSYILVQRTPFLTAGYFGAKETVSLSQQPADASAFTDYGAPRSGVQSYRYEMSGVSFYTTSAGLSRAYKSSVTSRTVTVP